MTRILESTQPKNWWAPVWRGLVVDRRAKHLKAMRSAFVFFIYCVLHADREAGALTRHYDTIARDMGVNIRTVRYWVSILKSKGYIETLHLTRSSAIRIQIKKWKTFQAPNQLA